MSAAQDLLTRLAIRHPIVQAPMAGVSTPQLAAATANAGALGSVALGASSVAQARDLLRATRALTSGPLNANVFCHTPAVADREREAEWLEYMAPLFQEFGATPPETLKEIYRSYLADEAMLDMLLEERPQVVSYHFGLPPVQWTSAMKDAGIIQFACVTTAEEAAQAEAAGVDALVAQGMEAGGHRGVFEPDQDRLIGTFALVSMLASRSKLPVIAAGGIMNGRGIAAALNLGASAVQLGTAFILCPESAANAQYRAALQSDLAYNTQITAAISGRPARGLVNRLYSDLGGFDAPALPDYPITYDATKALSAAAAKGGNPEFSVQWAGQGAPLARAMPAAELVKTLARELAEAQA